MKLLAPWQTVVDFELLRECRVQGAHLIHYSHIAENACDSSHSSQQQLRAGGQARDQRYHS